MKMPKLCKLRLGNILYIWFYMVSEPLWHTSFFFFQWLPRLHQLLLSTLPLLLPLPLLPSIISSPSNLPVTTTYCGKLKLFFVLRDKISLAISMEALLLHLNLSLLKPMETSKYPKSGFQSLVHTRPDDSQCHNILLLWAYFGSCGQIQHI